MRHASSRELLRLLRSFVVHEADKILHGGFAVLEHEILRIEREHREFGRGLSRAFGGRGEIGYRPPLDSVVDYFAVKVTFRESVPVYQNGEASGIRRDWLLGERLVHGAWERARKRGLRRREVIAFLEALDYPVIHSDRSEAIAAPIVARLDAAELRRHRRECREASERGGKCRDLYGLETRSPLGRMGHCAYEPDFVGGSSERPDLWGMSGYMRRACLGVVNRSWGRCPDHGRATEVCS